jgi:hypothetical protein
MGGAEDKDRHNSCESICDVKDARSATTSLEDYIGRPRSNRRCGLQENAATEVDPTCLYRITSMTTNSSAEGPIGFLHP